MATGAVAVVVAHGVALARRGHRRAWPTPLAAALAGAAVAPDGESTVLAAVLVAAGVAVPAAVWWFRRRTAVGLATAALAGDPRSVALLGRSPGQLAAAHVTAGAVLATAAGGVGTGAVGEATALAAVGVVAAALVGLAAVAVVRRRRRTRRTGPPATGAGTTVPGTLMVDHVVVRDGGVVVLDGVTVLVEPGEVVGVVGPTGAGKTTLCDVVTGAVAPDEGEVRPGGRVTRTLGEPAAVVVLDEPSAGLDRAAASALREEIRGAADAGATVLLAEHDMDFALMTCDRVLLLDRGAAVAAGPPEDVRVHPAAVAAYLGRAVEDVAP